MIPSFDRLYHQLGRATGFLFGAALLVYGITLLCAVLGLSHAAVSFGSVAASLAYAFAVLFGIFLLASLGAGLLRYLDRRRSERAV